MTRTRLLAFALALTATTSALAQTSTTPPTPPTPPDEGRVEVRAAARTVVDFTDAKITGVRDAPNGVIFMIPKKPKVRNLIELRANFRPELSTSPAQL